jgi:glycosyltransferase involved in cell wall biosynthesis
VLLVAQPPDGGVHRHITTVARALTHRGWRVLVAGPAPYAEIGDGVEHFEMSFDRRVDPRRDAHDAWQLHQLIAAERPALVHAHSSKAGALTRALRLLPGRPPVVYSPHGYAFAGYFTSARARGAYRLVESALAPLSSAIVCVCEAERALAQSLTRRVPAFVAYNGVPVLGDGPRHPQAAELATRGPLITVLAGLRPGKGIETAVDALPRIVRSHATATLAVIGEGPERAAILARAQALGVADRLALFGELEDPSAVLRAATIHLNPSWAESFPFAVLEGMAAGLPVVATDVGGTAEAIEDGRSGLLVSAQDAGALASTIAGLLDDGLARERLGNAARERVRQRFTIDSMVDSVERVYRQLL